MKMLKHTDKNDHQAAKKEASLLAPLDHPNIIRFKESFVDGDLFYMVTEVRIHSNNILHV